jgi:autotransporter passenger strand-loop-strand repeat protein
VSGGATIGTSVGSGAQQTVTGGGTASGTTVASGGSQTVGSGGITSGTTVASGGSQTVNAGGLTSGTTVASGGTQTVNAGGLTSGTTVASGGTQTVNSGGVTSGTTVASGGTQTVNAGGLTSGTTVATGGTQNVLSGGTANGSIVASGGVQNVSSGANVSGTQVLSGGTQHLFGSLTNPVVSSGGILTIGQGTAAGELVGSTVNNGLLVFNRPDAIAYAGNVTGAGRIEQQGTGTVVLNGDSHQFTGLTEVMSGTLAVGDIDNPAAQLGGDVVVDVPGTLRGHGSIAGSVTNNGVVMPGGSIGTLTIAGNYTQASNAALAIEVSPTSGSQLRVGGTAALTGGLRILYDPGTYSATRYAIVTAGAGVNGRFTNVSSTLASGAQLGSLQQSVEYGANEVDLVLSGADQPPPPDAGVPPDASAPLAVTIVAPTDTSIYTALGTTLALSAQAMNAALLERLALSGAGWPGKSVWANATGSQTKVHGTGSVAGFEARNYGFVAGLDQRVGAYRVGVAGGYNHSDISEDVTGNSGTTDTLRAALYGSKAFGSVDVSATVGAGVDFLTQKRPFGAAGTAEGDHVGQEATAAMQAALPLALGGVTVTPRIGLRFSYLHANGFTESGANGQDLAVGTDNVRSLQPYAQVTFDKDFGSQLRPLNFELRVGYARELLGTGRTVTVGAQDGTLFAAPGTTLPRDQLTTGASIAMQPTKALTLSLDYDALISTGHASAQAARVRIDYRF